MICVADILGGVIPLLAFSNHIEEEAQRIANLLIKKHGKDFDILLISWPPYNDYAINEAIQHWGAKKEILYIGEDDGCCANEEFFKMIKMKKSNIKQPQFSGMHDNLYHCHLKNKYDLTLKSSSKNKIS